LFADLLLTATPIGEFLGAIPRQPDADGGAIGLLSRCGPFPLQIGDGVREPLKVTFEPGN
jgi:hypothetical protein